MQLSEEQKLLALMLCDIRKQLPQSNDDNINFKLVENVIHSGNDWFFNSPDFRCYPDNKYCLNEEDKSFVIDVLDMYTFLHEGFNALSNEDQQNLESDYIIDLIGFDEKLLERKYIDVANFLINDLEKFSLLKGKVRNTHTKMTERYKSMLEVFEKQRASLSSPYILSIEQIQEVINAGL